MAGHPAHLITLGVVALVGILLIGRELRLRRPANEPTRGPALRVIGRTVAALAAVATIGVLVYLKPFSATPAAIAAMAEAPGARVLDSPTQIALEPQTAPVKSGLVFQPGARVDPRAYVPLLQQVSRTGVLVVIVKQPFDIGFTAIGAPSPIIAAHPEVKSWAVAGHSLGGVAASSFVGGHADTVKGLVLWASFPLGSLADTSLKVASISGTNDGLATPADIDASKADLPASTVFTPVEGSVHAFFGDYGAQPGDGTPTVSRDVAQQQIVAATVALMQSL
ncbi:MAG: alpha/beta hydrolase [Humibacillus sp.]|nr:alpha/beta hydrolase [Humibacillus sp.]MDN5777509.1 alpha/beta hydrolase [Humibacillus sp.]